MMIHQTHDLFFKISLTILLSFLIGVEREIRHKDAGLRPHILVGVGSALIVLTALYLADIYQHTPAIDPTRMITGIVTGIGFLCAGSIIKSGDSIRGITTAATLWIVSCVGIAVGSGQYDAAIFVTVIVIAVLIVLRPLEKYLGEKFKNIN